MSEQVLIALLCLGIGALTAFRVRLNRQARYADTLQAVAHPPIHQLDLSDFVLLVQGHTVPFEGGTAIALSEELHTHPEHMMAAVRSRIQADAKRPGA